MIHARLKRRLSEYLDGALEGRTKRRVERHLERCAECRGELAELRGTVLLLRSLAADEEPSEFLATRVLARIEAGDAAPRWADRVRAALAGLAAGAWTPALGAAAVVFVVAAALDLHVEVTLPGAQPAPSLATAARRATPPPPVSFDEPIQLVSAPTTPVRSARRFDPVVLEEVAGVQRACSARPHDAECQGFRNKLVAVALADPRGFVREIESVPMESRERVLAAVSWEAARTGHAQRVLYGLRRVDDPRAVGIVVRFQRTIASRE